MKRMVLEALRDGPKTRRQIVDYIAPLRPDVPHWRVDAAFLLQCLEAVGSSQLRLD
jgi:hypothetical protein